MTNAETQSTDPADIVPRENNTLRNRIIAAIFIIAVLLLLTFCARQYIPGSGQGGALRQALVDLRNHYDEPDETTAQLAARLKTADAVLTFVQNRIVTSPYAGRLQSPAEVLRTRSANSADKAVLLQTLLSELSVSTSMRAASLPSAMWPIAFERGSEPQRERPEAYKILTEIIGYTSAEEETENGTGLVDAAVSLLEGEAAVDAALESVSKVVPTDGLSASPATYMDWVWLVDHSGKVFDPVLPNEARPEFWRRYDRAQTPTQITLIAEDEYARHKTVLDWRGEAYGRSLSMGFLPTVAPHESLLGAPDLSGVKLWTPVLKVGEDLHSNAAVTTDGEVVPSFMVQPMLASHGQSQFDAPQITQARIASVDASRFPKVNVTIDATAASLPRWHSGHFVLRLAGRLLPVRIEEQFSTRHPVIVLADQTGSTLTNDNWRAIKEFGQTLVGNLSVEQRVGLFGLRHSVHARHLFDPIKDPTDLANSPLWDAQIGGQGDMLDSIDVALNALMLDVGENPAAETKIVLVSDGAPSRFEDDTYAKRLEALRARAKSFNASIVLVLVGSKSNAAMEALATETGGKIIRVGSQESARGDALALASELAGTMTISFVAPPRGWDYAKDENLPLNMKIAGFDGELTGEVIVPELLPSGVPALYLRVVSGEHEFTRKLVALGNQLVPERLTAETRITLAPGTFNANMIEAGRYGQWLLALDALSGREDEVEAFAEKSPLDVESMERINVIANRLNAAQEATSTLKFPLVTIMTVQHDGAPKTAPLGDEPVSAVEETAEERSLKVQLDVPAWHGLTLQQAKREQAVRLGLALNDAEARSIGSDFNLTDMLASPEAELKSAAAAAVTNLARSDFSFQPAEDLSVLRLAKRDDVVWINYQAQGRFHGYIVANGLAAKGTQDVVIAEKFARIRQAIGLYDTAVSPLVGAPKIAFKGLIGFKLEELKMWCYSSVMLGYVNEVIAGEDDALLSESTSKAEARAAKLCKMNGGPGDFDKNLFKAAAVAFGKTWAKQFIRKGATGRLTKPYVNRFSKSTGIDKAGDLLPPALRDYISKLSKGIRRKTPYTPEGIAEKITNAGLDGTGSTFGAVFSSKLAGAIDAETGGR